jgi:archaellum component FlaC
MPAVTSEKGAGDSMNIDERIEALVMTVELLTHDVRDLTHGVQDLTHDVQDLKTAAQQDGENIRALARIAELHHERLTRLEE